MISEQKEVTTGSANIGQESRRGWRVLTSGILLLAIPILFLVTISQLTKARGPQWMPYTFENPYNYLLTSLSLVKGHSPSYIMHPGTTTQVFGAIVLRLSSLKSTDDLIEETLRHPEQHIKELHEALLIFTTLILWIGPWLTAVILRNNIVGLLIQAPCLFLRDFWWWGIQFGPELMLVGFGVAACCCCVLLVSPSYQPERMEIVLGLGHRAEFPGSTRVIRLPLLAVLTGLICALGLVTKLVFFPLLLIAVACCRSRRSLLSFVLAFVVGSAIALIPIYPQLPRLLKWISDLATHSGTYGTGPVGLPNVSVYLANVFALLQKEPIFAVIASVTGVVVTLLALLPRPGKVGQQISWRISVPVFALQLISFLIISKDPAPRYYIPLCISLGLNLVLFFYGVRGRRSLTIRAVGGLALVGLLVLGFKDFIEQAPSTYSYMRQYTANQLRLYRLALEVTKNDVRVDYFFSDSPELPLCDGDDAADDTFGPLLAKLYPNRLFFNVYNGQFQTFTEWISPETILKKYDHLYFLGNTRFFPTVPGFDPSTFLTIDHTGEFYLQKWTRR